MLHLNLKKKLLLLIFVPFCASANNNYVKYANPLVGTDSSFPLSNGNLYPCIARPWGMNHWTPQTANNGERWQYEYRANHIVGFKQTHQPSPWVGDYGMISLMPTTDKDVFREEDRKSWFSHKTEIVLPHYYKVYLADYNVTAELTPTQRSSYFRFTFPKNDKSNIIIDAFDNNSYIKIIPEENKIVGWSTQSYGYDERKPENFKNYFVIEFNKKFNSYKIWKDSVIVKDIKEINARRTGAILTFTTENNEAIEAKVSSSFISIEQAEINLNREINNKSFDETLEEGYNVWNNHFERFKINDINIENLERVKMFYTCLYRLLLYPREFHEINYKNEIKHYSPYNGKIENGRMYTDNGFWDTFRAVHPFLNLFYPSVSEHIMEALTNTYKESGWLPEWASPGHLGDSMIGSNSTSLIASAYLQGIKMDIDTLWDAVLKNAYNAHPKYLSVGRAGIEAYTKLGYIPNDIGIKESAARTLEYSYADFCIYKLANRLGKKKEEKTFFQRALNYNNLFYKRFNLMSGRDSKGNFDKNFNPVKWGGDFTEGCSLHYTWSVFHDPLGLKKLMGGENRFIEMLDTIFTMPPIFDTSAYGGIIHEMREMQIAGFGQYAHGNQPIQHMIYFYNWTKQPWKCQYWTRKVNSNLYKPTPDGYCGDEDNGQTSAWYIFSSLGFYPVCPVSGEFIITSPQFKDIEIKLESGKSINIKAQNNSNENVYIESLNVNNKNYSNNFFKYDDLIKGMNIDIQMNNRPNLTRNINSESYPYSLSK